MKNGPYEMVVAPAEYPGKKYRGRYVYEHQLVWWQKTGEVVPKGFLIHHKDENKRNNVPDNLELISKGDHVREHAAMHPVPVPHGTITGYSNHKCRCDPCREAWNTHAAAYRRKLRQEKKRDA